MEKLKAGEKYLNVVVLGSIKLSLFPNKNKKSDKDPDFIGNGCACWVNEKKETAPIAPAL